MPTARAEPPTAPAARRSRVALIEEPRCIGCTLCMDACPFDAIVGASGWMHAVVEPWCTGCALCVAPCPVDCIAMVPAEAPWSTGDARAAAQRARRRNIRRAQRFARPEADRGRRRAVLAAALQRARRA